MPCAGGEFDIPAGAYRPSGEPFIAMPPLPGDAWFAKKGSDFVHSFVYCAAVLVAPRADRRGEVVAL